MTKESVKTGQKTLAGYGDIVYCTDHHLQLYLKNTNVNPANGKELNPAKLKTIARILTPNPPTAFGVEIPEPNYERLMQVIDGIKRASLEA